MAQVVLSAVEKSFGETIVLKPTDLAVADGEFVVLVGPSGSGKSTLLRLIAGLEEVSAGTIAIGGEDVTAASPSNRGIAMVFQSYALYPHLSVYENLAFALRLAQLDKDEIDRRVRGAAEILAITDLLARKPRALSGGQRQRVAIGRAIVREPKVFLFDEPLSNLDAALRVSMRYEFARLHKQLGTTMIYVTHDQVEAMTLAQRIVVLSGGRIMQVGTPDEIYNHPRSRFVAGFTGSPPMNFLAGRVRVSGEQVTVALGAGGGGASLAVPVARSRALRTLADREVILGIRPEDIRLAAGGESDQPLAARVEVCEPLGAETLLTLSGPAGEFVARVGPAAGAAPGSAVCAWLDMGKLQAFDPVTGEAVGAPP